MAFAAVVGGVVVAVTGGCGSSGVGSGAAGGRPFAGTGGRSDASGGAAGDVGRSGAGGATAAGGATLGGEGGSTASGGGGQSGAAAAGGGQIGTGGGLGGQGAGVAGVSGTAGRIGGGAGRGGETGGARAGGNPGGDAGRAGMGAGGNATPAFDRVAVTALMKRVADYEIARFGAGNDNGWVRATFHAGLLAASAVLGDVKYRNYTLQWARANNWRLSAASGGLRFADNQACVQSYAELYMSEPVAATNAVMIAAAQTTFDAMVAAPMLGRTEWWWCDALFMAPPAFARMAQATGKADYLTLMHNMFWDTKAFLFDPAQNLFWRDATFRNTATYWSRGNGWVVAGIARILEALPPADARRADYEALLRQMATKLRGIQASDGFWRSGLIDQTTYAMPESSGTAFFCFGMAWGINNGVLDRATYLPTVTKAWAALVSAVNAQGRLGWVQAVGAAPGPSTIDSTNDYATGALLMAGNELLKL